MTTSQQKRGRPNINQEVRSSAHAFLVPNVLATIDLLDYAPEGESMKSPRSFQVLGDLALDGEDVPVPGCLVAMRLDGATLVLPINAGSVGLPFDIQLWKLLTSGIGGVISTNRSGPAVTFTGTPAATAQIIVEITTTGDLNVGAYRYSLDGGATYTAPATLPADGTDVLGASGITANFVAGTYTDGDYYMANVGVTDVRDILINW